MRGCGNWGYRLFVRPSTRVRVHSVCGSCPPGARLGELCAATPTTRLRGAATPGILPHVGARASGDSLCDRMPTKWPWTRRYGCWRKHDVTARSAGFAHSTRNGRRGARGEQAVGGGWDGGEGAVEACVQGGLGPSEVRGPPGVGCRRAGQLQRPQACARHCQSVPEGRPLSARVSGIFGNLWGGGQLRIVSVGCRAGSTGRGGMVAPKPAPKPAPSSDLDTSSARGANFRQEVGLWGPGTPRSGLPHE